MENPEREMLIQITSNDYAWHTIDDSTQDGRSQSFVEQEGSDYCNFFGKINSYNGGFCRARADDFPEPINMEDYLGICLEVRSDRAMNYKFGIHDRIGYDSVFWQAQFTVPKTNKELKPDEQWQLVEIPFATFKALQNEELVNAGPMELRSVYSFELILSKTDFSIGKDVYTNKKFRSGKFSLNFKDIAAYGFSTMK